MQAVTVSAPWSVLVCDRAPAKPGESRWSRYALKRFETRSWRILPNKLPLRIAIHSGKRLLPIVRAHITERPTKEVGRNHFASRFIEPYASALMSLGYSDLDPWQRGYLDHFEDLRGGELIERGENPHPRNRHIIPVSAIVGIVTVVEIVPSDVVTRAWKKGDISDLEYSLGDFSPGRYAWLFTDPVRLQVPIPYAGMQGLWHVSAPVACDIDEEDEYTPPRRLRAV